MGKHFFTYAYIKNEVNFNTLFARAVIDQRVSGSVYANDEANPETFYIIHSYGMSLLLGNTNNQNFNEAFKTYTLNVDGQRVSIG